MYFILSKVLLFILSPYLWVCALLLLTFFAKNTKRKRKLFITTLIVMYLFSCPLLLTLMAKAWGVSNSLQKVNKTYSCVIVLGGFTSYDEKENGYFNGAADRFIQGILLLKTGKAKHLLITGGNGNLIQGTFREGDWVKAQLKNLDYPDSSILIENQSRNTIENAVFSKKVLQKAHLQPPYLLVTSNFHMRRALMIFRKAGYNVDPYPCNFGSEAGGLSFNDLIPSGGTLDGWTLYFKEMVGYVVDGWKKY
jgi:uncharacterized SAM-binding protein YcdF (DUF218 family)